MNQLSQPTKNSQNPHTKFILFLGFIWLLFLTLGRRQLLSPKAARLFLTSTVFLIGPAMLYIAWAPGLLQDLTKQDKIGGWRGFLTIAGLFITLFTLANFANITYNPHPSTNLEYFPNQFSNK